MPSISKRSLVAAFSLTSGVLAQTYTDSGLVGYASLAADLVDSLGDTLGGIGSAAAFAPGTWKKHSDGTYTGTLFAQPDRGYNVQGTTNYASRHQVFDITLKPYYGDEANGAVGSLQLNYKGAQAYVDPLSSNRLTTGLDPTGIRPATGLFPALPIAGPNNAICVDSEGLVTRQDGNLWVSDEYGPFIYYVSAAGEFLSAIEPPRAILPLDTNGQRFFTSAQDPATGRVANQGYEALTTTPDNKYLYAMLQSATVQDGGSGDFRGKYTRMVQYDVSDPFAPVLVGEWVVELPVSNSGQARGQSEMYFISPTRFLVLARDGNGNGDGDPPTPSKGDLTSKIKNIGYIDISDATNIANSVYDEPSNPVAPGGVLTSGVTAAVWQPFLSLIEDDQLAKAGLQNGRPQITDIVGKYESIALAPVNPENPSSNEYFVFTLADNDYITKNGIIDGVPYAEPYAVGTGVDVPNQFLVFRVTLPGIEFASYLNGQTPVPSGLAQTRQRRAENAKRLAGFY